MKKEKIFYGWWIVFGSVLITTTMVPVVMALFNKFLIPVTTDLGVTRSAFALSSTITQSLGIVFSPFIAKHLAGNHLKKIQTVSVIGFAIAYASYSFAQTIYHFYIASFFVGLFFLCATIMPISMMITNWFVAKRGLAMSIAMTGIGVGGFIFSPTITYLIENYGWRMSYRIMALIILVVALPIVLFVFKRKPEDMGLQPYGVDAVEMESSNSPKKESKERYISLSVKQSYTTLFFILLLIGMFFNGFINNGALGQFPPALRDLHGETVAASIISLYSIIGIFGKLLLGWINDRFGVVASTIFGCVTFAASFVFLLFGESMIMVYGMAIMFGLGLAIGTVSPPLVTGAIFGPEKYSEAYGVVNSFTQIGLSVGSLAVAQIFDQTGSYQVAWMLLIGLTFVTMFGWIFAFKASRKYCG